MVDRGFGIEVEGEYGDLKENMETLQSQNLSSTLTGGTKQKALILN